MILSGRKRELWILCAQADVSADQDAPHSGVDSEYVRDWVLQHNDPSEIERLPCDR